MAIADERAAFHLAHLAWGAGDFDGFMALIADDIVYTVNVDGEQLPYAASTVGKEQVRQRMLLLLDTFVVNAFVMEHLVHEPTYSRSSVLGYYTHKKTGEYLEIKIRFRGWVKDGLITRLEEYHDAAYVEAFHRFVTHLQAAAQGGD